MITTIVIGAGDASEIVYREFKTNKKCLNKIVCYVDDDPNKIGTFLHRIPIEGPISNIDLIVKKYNAQEIIVAISSLGKEKLEAITNSLSNFKIRLRRLNLLSEIKENELPKLIPVNIDELLGRNKVILDNREITSMIKNKTVLVTGAGGSIGSELVRQLFLANPEILILFDIYENTLYDIEQELFIKLRKEYKSIKTKIIALVGSTYNYDTIEKVFKTYRPDYVYHAAAYKHVPLMESCPIEAIRTNVIGTYNVAKLCGLYKTKKMILVSTDKAVRPTNVMGATKRFAELIIQHFDRLFLTTSFASVRFGNVLGSHGSVIPLFEKQIEAGGPVTITDFRIIRYFMTIKEAVSLIIQCSLFAVGGEIFVLDMGKPIKILDLAKKMIVQKGLIPGEDIKIIETGLRPGEKLFEELLVDDSIQRKTINEKIFVEEPNEKINIEDSMKRVCEVFKMNNEDVKGVLKEIIVTYKSPEEVN